MTEISLGDWQAGLFACSPEDEALLGLFWDRYGSSALQPRIPEQFPRHVLVSHLAFLEQGAEPVGLPGQIRLHWDWLREHWLWLIRSLQNHVAATQPSNPFAPKRSTPAQRSAVFSLNAAVLDRFRQSPGDSRENLPDEIVLLVFNEDPHEGDPIRLYFSLLRQATRWHVGQGSLIIHSAAVMRNGGGFLFLGDSDAGKSTIALMSTQAGDDALGDDMNFIIHTGGKDYRLAAAPGPAPPPMGYSAGQPPLRAVFKLVQDTRDFLVPLSPMALAQEMFTSVTQIPFGRQLPEDLTAQAFHNAASIARSVPGYELHFRESTEFWNVIDAEFGT